MGKRGRRYFRSVVSMAWIVGQAVSEVKRKEVPPLDDSDPPDSGVSLNPKIGMSVRQFVCLSLKQGHCHRLSRQAFGAALDRKDVPFSRNADESVRASVLESNPGAGH